MLFLNIFASLLLLGGPIVGYQVAMRRRAPRRWGVIAWSAAGGAVGAVVLIGVMLFAELWSFKTAGELLRPGLPLVGWYALVGLALGFVGVATPRAIRRRVFSIGLVIVGLVAVIVVVKDAAATRLAEQSTRGLVFGPGNVPAAGAPVFLDRGFGSVERLTTDSAGQFRALLKLRRNREAILLICVPGGVPKLARPLEDVVTLYRVTAIPARGRVHGHLREQGWLQPIPRECLAGSGDAVR
jgi:hypothetical protein